MSDNAASRVQNSRVDGARSYCNKFTKFNFCDLQTKLTSNTTTEKKARRLKIPSKKIILVKARRTESKAQ